MTEVRYFQLEQDTSLNLTEEEVAEGWHWCIDWDGMLVGPGMIEMECCGCS